ncbi:hypothetical protein [Novosphingobium decolorationis]|uniref:Uncharacterized protein n=1 Tax=Novosphingobium decolorationis TaxID=2698673 RepID=A0ABX8E1E7_9SPHN|nr:hypothetical protein [Novosphingobium decolorationis]MED5545647.1 hypothetical protein [Pseudomonadota bacterium]QVM82959.1 hypothetical protein HT578_03860 [Novosphingobium decolorationis]
MNRPRILWLARLEAGDRRARAQAGRLDALSGGLAGAAVGAALAMIIAPAIATLFAHLGAGWQ